MSEFSSPASVTLHLHGPFLVTNAGGQEISGLSRRGQAMLAYLSQQPGMGAERGLLADLLWSDRSEEQARASLRQELSVLRRHLPDGILEANRQRVRLDEARVDINTSTGEFLQGFDLASEGFEDWLRQMRSAEPVAEIPSPAALSLKRGARPVLAVMPFDELGETAADMFSDGVVDEITGTLSRVAEFHVIARQSAFALRGKQIDVPQVAARLGADYLVEGTVQRVGERVRISVQLVEGDSGRTIWGERFDDHLDDLFDLQDRIAALVAGQLAPSLRQAEITRASQRQPNDRTAYDLVLTALPHFWAHRKEENAQAIKLLDAAIDRDTEYGPALAYRAWALAQKPVYMWSDDPVADQEDAAAAAKLAAEMAGNHAPSLVAVGAALSLTTSEISDSRGFLDRALQLDPNNAWGWMRSGWTSIYEGKSEAALEDFARADALSPIDPFHFNILLGRSVCYRFRGDFDASVRLIREGMRANPGITWAYRMLVGDLILAERDDETAEAIAAFLHHYPHVTLKYLRACWPYSLTRYQPAYYDAFIRAGIPEE